MSDAAIHCARLLGISHRYGKTTALDGISLEIPAGCMAGIIGPDGVGKSTLLGLIAGAVQIQAGVVETLGGNMRSRRFRNSVSPGIAYMPQGLGKNLYPSLSVFENVDFFGRLFGHSAADRELRIAELLESTGLTPFRDRPAGQLSGGMKQKLSLCCSLIHDPDLLILDEPTTGIDPLSRRQFWELIERVRHRRPGMSVIVSTAYMDEAKGFDWLAAMDEGRVLAIGSPAELMERTRCNDLDAAFIALLPVQKRGGHRSLVIPPRPTDGHEIAIEAEGLTKRFGDFTAVDNVNFKIERGEIFGFLGSNGCGKTTTMKMLTGLLPVSEGKAWLFGHPVNAGNMETRKRVGYMSQSFSLYTELTSRQNLDLHARLYGLPRESIAARVEQLLQEFELGTHADFLAESLPLGMRQRLSLAVAVVHGPEMLILDEPTSGVDPVARDQFWELLIKLSRDQGVTIFISTHFMNEGERCDRISLMHAGNVLACDAPRSLVEARGSATLEDAFISYLEEASGAGEQPPESEVLSVTLPPAPTNGQRTAPARFSLGRAYAYAQRETLELIRDPIRLTFALAGSALLMLVLGYGITLDVEHVPFAVLDWDKTPESRDYVQNLDGSRYFDQRSPIRDVAELDRRMQSGELGLVLDIPPGFGRDLKRGRSAEIGVWIDGAMPFRGETIRGYAQGSHYHYLADASLRTTGVEPQVTLANVEMRYRYNQDFKSLDAMAPAVIPMMLVFIPTILMSLSIVREKELGSITNLYVTPVTRLEFLLGKQFPYVVVSMVSFLSLVAIAIYAFRVPLKGSILTLTIGALIYVIATTGLGLLLSAFTRTQMAALSGAAVATLVPTVQFSGLTDPVSSLEGAAAIVGQLFPATYFINISRGVFNKGLGLADLWTDLVALAAFIPVLTTLSLVCLKKQGR